MLQCRLQWLRPSYTTTENRKTDEVELLDEYKEKLLAMRIEIIKLKAENQKLESELDFLRRQQEGVSDVK